jgi:hypothetical protein
MGLLSRLFEPRKAELIPMPSGSFTLDRDGQIMTSTLPRSFPQQHLKAIGEQVLATFRAAKRAQTPLGELIIYYGALKLLARELRGGAIVFLMPQSMNQQAKKNPEPKKTVYEQVQY